MFAGTVDLGPINDVAEILLSFIVLYVGIPLIAGVIAAGIYLLRVPPQTRSGIVLFGAFCAGSMGALLIMLIFGLIMSAAA